MIEYTVQVSEDKTEWRNPEGKLHRENGPAVEWNDGEKEWFVDGLRHRTDGPAREWANGFKEWYINNTPLNESQFYDLIKGRTVTIENISYKLQSI
jgi:hypothetical protein